MCRSTIVNPGSPMIGARPRSNMVDAVLVPKQLHLELAVTDLDDGEQAAMALGAKLAGVQPSPDRWRVLIDPAGHPFCLSNQIPEP